MTTMGLNLSERSFSVNPMQLRHVFIGPYLMVFQASKQFLMNSKHLLKEHRTIKIILNDYGTIQFFAAV